MLIRSKRLDANRWYLIYADVLIVNKNKWKYSRRQHMSNNIAWKNIEWDQVQHRINRIQRRIYQASKENNKKKVNFLQKILIHSLDAKLLAVKCSTTETQALKGINDKIYNTDIKKMTLVKTLKVDGIATWPIGQAKGPSKGIDLVKPGKSKQRSLGFPNIRDRAKQHLVLQALEPEWEAKFEPTSYGFRPGRSCYDAVVAVFKHLKLEKNESFKKYVLEADLKGCFDTISHPSLLKKLNTTPDIERQVKAWLEAGIMESNLTFGRPVARAQNSYGDTTSTSRILEARAQLLTKKQPQVGILSPFLTNVALHGIENHLKDWISNKPNPTDKPMSQTDKKKALTLIRYADAFVILHRNENALLEVKTELVRWLENTSGLKLNENKTRIVCSTNGFSFLGFRFINLTRSNRMRIKIYPDKASVINVTNKIGTFLRNNRAISTYDLIEFLKPIISGWCNYYAICECSETFKKLDYLLYQMLRSWVFRRDRRHGREYVKEKYFPSGNQYNYRGKLYTHNWILVGSKKVNQTITEKNFLPLFSWTASQTHIKIRSDAEV